MKIEGYFEGIKNANEAVEKLKNAGFTKAYSDINEYYMNNSNITTDLPGTETAPSLSGVVLGSEDPLNDPKKAPLMAASPMVSGMGGFEEIADVNYRVVVEAEEKDKDRIQQLIKEAGGDMQSPNYQVPKGLENIPTDEFISTLTKL